MVERKNEMRELVGKVITKVELNDDDTIMVFTAKDGEKIAYATGAECCSETWFAAINGFVNLIEPRGFDIGRIVSVEDRPEIINLPSTRQEYDILYGYFITTQRGICEIEFRNASNGYYGGSCELSDAESVVNLREIRADF